MIQFQERKKMRKILYSKTSILVLFILAVFVARGAWNISQKAQIARTERDDAVKNLQDIQTRGETIKKSLFLLGNDQGMEQEVRQKFSVAGLNEEVVVVIDENAKKSKNGGTVSDLSLWQRFMSLFGK